MTAHLRDEDVARVPASVFVDAARRALVDAHRGSLHAPPRSHVELGASDVVLTTGGYDDGPFGFRVYVTGRPAEQATLVWEPDGALAAVISGDLFGQLRTGALGGVAVDVLARADATDVAVIGAGRQAWAQVWAVTSVRDVSRVRGFSRTESSRTAFARRVGEELAVGAEAVGSAEAAVRDADIVLLATRADRPVIDAGWVKAGAHVTTVGPKTVSAYECPRELADGAAIAATDAPAQVAAYPEPCFTSRELQHLGAIVDGAVRGREQADELTFYLSSGLAGSEVAIAHAVVGGMPPEVRNGS